jgi:hypothetical protein
MMGELNRNNATDSDREAFSANREIAPVRGYSRPRSSSKYLRAIMNGWSGRFQWSMK